MSNYKKNSQRPLLWIMILLTLIFAISCEDYEDQTFVLSEQEQLACDRLADTLIHDLDAADLRFYGPAWSGTLMENTMASTERIGTSWYNADFEVEPDVYIFTDGADTVAAMQILSFTYDEETVKVDSILMTFSYNTVGDRAFAGLSKDTILAIDFYTTPLFVDFSQGFVSESANWNISINENVISQATSGTVFRKEDATLAALTTAPEANYAADISGYEVAFEYLTRNEGYLTDSDSLLLIELESSDDAGYLLWDRQGNASSEIIFYATDLMTIAVWDENGDFLTPVENSISMELVAYCHDLKTRAVYELDQDTYLIQFRPHEKMSEQNFRLAIMEGE